MKTVFIYKEISPDMAAAKKKAILRIFADALKEQKRAEIFNHENMAHESLYQTSGGITCKTR